MGLNLPMTDEAPIVRVYTAQAVDVLQVLNAGQTHVQAWSNSAAFTLDEPRRSLHRRAYEYMARQYELRVGQAMTGAPTFVTPDLATARSALQKKPDGRLLVLDMPAGDLLMHNYQFWAWILLSELDRCGEHEWEQMDRCPSKACALSSWSMVFDVPNELYNRQAVVNRVEPSWLVRVE
jgi:hypothetical protein